MRFFILSSYLVLITCLSAGCSDIAQTIHIEIDDPAPYHVHQNNEKAIAITISAPDDLILTYRWHDLYGAPLSKDLPIATNKTHDIKLPSATTGYYGLRLQNKTAFAFENRIVGEPREYGFVIFPKATQFKNTSPFGTVHTDIKDPYMPPWVKTITWHTAHAIKWQRITKYIANHNKKELPLIMGDKWSSDDSKPILNKILTALYDRALEYFKASPSIHYWEVGLEENLQDTYQKTFYWQNLERKFLTLKKASQKAKTNIKLIYQVVGIYPQGVETFFKEKAYRYIDIISLHPYAWPDFTSPDTWLPKLLNTINKLQIKHNTKLPIWITEIGAPHFGNYKGGFFGYPKDNNPTGGLSKTDSVSFLVKLCVLSRSHNVKKIFWYNYKDQNKARDEVEAHFGLRDYWGYPKPVYAAYHYVTQLLKDIKGEPLTNLSPTLKAFHFQDKKQNFIVIWRTISGSENISFNQLGLTHVTLTTATGRPLPRPASRTITIGNTPIFIYDYKKDQL